MPKNELISRKISQSGPALAQHISGNLNLLKSKIPAAQFYEDLESQPFREKHAKNNRQLRNEIKYLIWDTKTSFAQLNALQNQEAGKVYFPVSEEGIQAEDNKSLSSCAGQSKVENDLWLPSLTKKFQILLDEISDTELLDREEIENSGASLDGKTVRLSLPQIPEAQKLVPKAVNGTGMDSEESASPRQALSRLSSQSLDVKYTSSQRWHQGRAKKILLEVDDAKLPEKKLSGVSSVTIRQTTGSWKRKRCMIPLVFVGGLMIGVLVLVFLILFYFRATKIA